MHGPLQVFAARIRTALAARTGLALDEIRLESPRDEALGDLAFPCFALAKARRAAPPKIAVELARELGELGELEALTVAASGPYLNFTIERGALAHAVLAAIAADGAGYGGSDEGRGRTVVIDYSSPNIAKPMHVGHLRSTIIGAAIGRLHAHQGYRVVGINHIGDWGSQFGALVVALRRWRGEVELERDPVLGLLELYQRSKAALENDAAFRDEARLAWRELESGVEGEVRALWRWVTEVSLAAFERTYARLGIHHDLVRGESFYEPLIEDTMRRVQAAGVVESSEGALIVDLTPVDPGLKATPCLLRQSDGTTLYATRDLAALFQRWEEFAFERCLYVVGQEQKLHFRQLKAVLRRMQLDWEDRVEHVDFGLLLGAGLVKLATRKGQVLVLDELLDEVVEEARRIVAKKNPELTEAERERVAEEIGVGAVLFNDLKRERIKDVLFDKAEILSFEGETGPYVQYTHARLASIERKAAAAGVARGRVDPALLADAGSILLRLGRFPDVVQAAARAAEPSLVSTWLLSLCREVNSWYVAHRVLGVEPPLSSARLALVGASKSVIANGLRLLGLVAPEEM
jgi:arginyl-tRNA synthetase